MSNPGIYSGIYTQIREYAELVDLVLIGIKSNISSINDQSRQKLAKLLTNLEPNKWDNISTRIIATMLINEDKINPSKWSKMVLQLHSDKPDPSLVVDLEGFAQTLEQLQADTLTRMKGMG